MVETLEVKDPSSDEHVDSMSESVVVEAAGDCGASYVKSSIIASSQSTYSIGPGEVGGVGRT